MTDTQQAAGRAAAQAVTTPDGILQLGLGFWGSKTLLSAVELGVFTELGDGHLDGEALVARLGLHTRGARDFLDALVALGMLDRVDGQYANTAETAMFLNRNTSSYIGGMLEMANARLYPFWGSLTEALRTGHPQNEVKQGGDFFAELYRDPGRLAQFLHAMTGLSTGAHRAMARSFPWERYQTFVDVGCAEGGLAVELGLAHGHLQGQGFDLPPAQAHFERYVEGFGLGERLRFHPGDFFSDPLPDTDVLVMGHILHDWDLAEKQNLLEKAYAALPEGGALIVFEALIDDERSQNAFGLLMSLNMLIETPGGFDYTGSDCQSWMAKAGFRDSYVEHLAGPDSMVVAFK